MTMIPPTNISLLDWAAQLQIDFSGDDVPLLFNESEWVEWSQRLVACQSFVNNNVPDGNSYSNWHDWAQRVYDLMQ